MIIYEWDGLQGELKVLPGDEQEKIQDYFNGIIDEHDDIGTLLVFGDVGDFSQLMTGMEESNKEIFADEVLKVELLDSGTD